MDAACAAAEALCAVFARANGAAHRGAVDALMDGVEQRALAGGARVQAFCALAAVAGQPTGWGLRACFGNARFCAYFLRGNAAADEPDKASLEARFQVIAAAATCGAKQQEGGGGGGDGGGGGRAAGASPTCVRILGEARAEELWTVYRRGPYRAAKDPATVRVEDGMHF